VSDGSTLGFLMRTVAHTWSCAMREGKGCPLSPTGLEAPTVVCVLKRARGKPSIEGSVGRASERATLG